jgi:hypothetical protein
MRSTDSSSRTGGLIFPLPKLLVPLLPQSRLRLAAVLNFLNLSPLDKPSKPGRDPSSSIVSTITLESNICGSAAVAAYALVRAIRTSVGSTMAFVEGFLTGTTQGSARKRAFLLQFVVFQRHSRSNGRRVAGSVLEHVFDLPVTKIILNEPGIRALIGKREPDLLPPRTSRFFDIDCYNNPPAKTFRSKSPITVAIVR